MSSLSLNHFSIRSVELNKTSAFYSQALGLTEGPRPSFPFPGVWLYNGDHGSYANAVLHVIGIDKNDPEGLKQYLGDRDLDSLSGTGCIDHVAFFATGLKQRIEVLTSLQIPFRERTVPSLNLHQIFLDDPTGVVIELNYPAEEKIALDSQAA
ncbi:MAG: glyoxalase [Alcaligenaceae bacterium]|jgi:hypothetical protein